MSFEKCGLRFREVDPNDLPFLRDWRNDPAMSGGWHDPSSVQTEDEQRQWYYTLNRENQAYIVEERLEGTEIVGLLRFRLYPAERRAALTGTDVPIHLHGKGYGKRILRAGAEYILHDLGYHRVTAEAMESNVAATAIIQSANFKHEGCYREYVWRGGKWHNWHIFSLLEGEL